MTRDHKVVPISSAAPLRQQNSIVSQGPLPALLAALRDRALTYLRVGLSELFDNADDSLFEKAGLAHTNAEQSVFFDAMRLLRLQRQTVEKAFCDGFDSEFATLQHGHASKVTSSAVSFDLDTLSLVQPDELEQTVALDGMINRADIHNQAALAHLTLRLNSLVASAVTDISNPLAPSRLVQLFADSCAPINLDIRVRLIIFKMFERYVLKGIESLYADANALLANAGILPDLKREGLRSRPRNAAPVSPQRSQSVDPVGVSDDQQVLSLFSELLGKWRHASGDSALSALAAPSAAPVYSAELLDMLGQLAAEQRRDFVPGEGDLREYIKRQLDQEYRKTGELRRLEPLDDNVISLVSMLFDSVLDDPELPSALKALIGRMQLPILRVAIGDKSFFNRSSHPARRLLNELARATMGWSDHDDLRRDQLHGLLERMVERMLIEQLADASFFEQMHDELSRFMQLEKRRAARLEQRVRDAEEGRARVDAARHYSVRALNNAMAERNLPAALVELLKVTWYQVLQMTFLREGANSSAWREAVATIDLLIRSVDELSADESLEQRQALNSDVRQRLSDGLGLIGEEQPEQSPQLAVVTTLQKTMLAGSAAVTSAEVVQQQRIAELPEQLSSLTGRTVAVQPSAPSVDAQRVLVTEPVLDYEEPQADIFVEDLPDVATIHWMDNLHTGSWFELAKPSKPAQRCKLAAIISFSGKYIFVNRSGVKVAEFARSELMQCYAEGGIRQLSDDQLFDRALESVIGNLRRLREQQG